MTRDHRLLRNATALLMGQAITKLVNIAASVVMVRWLGAEQLGQYSYIVAFCFPFGALADFGLAPLAIREISRERAQEGRVVATLDRLLLTLTVLAGVAMLGLAVLTQHDRLALLGILIVAASNLVSSLTVPCLVTLTAREEMHLLALHRIAASVVGSLATLAVLVLGGRVLPLLLASAGTTLLMLFLARSLVGRRDPLPPARAKDMLAMLRQAVPFGLWMVGFALYYRVDMVMLKWLRGSREVGLYAAAYRFLDTVVVVGASLGNPFLPRLSSLVRKNVDEARALLEGSWRPLLALGLPLSIGTSFIAEPLVLAIFGGEYLPAGTLLRILIWGSLPILCINIPNHALNAADRVWHLAAIYGVSVAVNVLANLLLIPRWGAAGASAVTVFCEWLNLLLVVWVLRKAFGISASGEGLWRYLAAAGGMTCALALARGSGLVLEIVLGALVYAGGLVLLGYLRSPDLAALKRVLTQ